MSHPSISERFPRGPLFGAAALVSLALVSVATARIGGFAAGEAEPEAVSTRDLRFEDRSDGGVAVYDARSQLAIDVVAPGSNGFLRATLRGLARERKRQGVGAEIPFRLTELADGRITLDDPSTGRHVDLEAFGPTNAGAFTRFLTAAQGAR
jgi:putative photosynthetic complex assembly protein